MIPPQSMLTIKNQAAKNLLGLLAAVTFFAACAPSGVRCLFEGKRLLETGQYQAAVEKLRSATVLLGGTNAQAYNYLGLACHHAGQFAEAEKAYQRALSVGPNLAEVHFNLGCLWFSENKVDQAKSELTAFTMRRSNSAEGWATLGTVQAHLREFPSAEKSFLEALRVQPHSPEALTGLGLVRLQRGHPTDAAQLFAKALNEQSTYAPALLNWAIVAQENMRDPRLALEKYRAYLALKPVPENAESVKLIVHQLELELAPPARPSTSNLVSPANTNAAKLPVSESARQSAPTRNSSAETGRTAIVAKVETPTDMARPPTNIVKNVPVVPALPPPDTNFDLVKLAPDPVFKAATDISPAPPESVEPPGPPNLVVTSAPPLVSASKPAKRSFFQRINPISLFSGPEKTAKTPSQPAFVSSGPQPDGVLPAGPTADAGAGTASFLRYAYLSPDKPETGNHTEAEHLFAQALQAQQARRLTEAIQTYRQATQIDPAYFDAYYNLGLAAAESGNLRASLSAYEAALAIRPESLDTRYNFALALKQANYPIDAANELERLLALYPNDSRAHLALGNLYAQQLGQPAKARHHYMKVLETDPRNPQAAAVRYWLTDNPK